MYISRVPFNRISLTLFDFNVYIYRLRDFKLINKLKEHRDQILCFENLDNNKLATGSSDNSIRIWDLCSFKFINKLRGHSDWVRILRSWSNDMLLSASYDKTIILWKNVSSISKCLVASIYDDRIKLMEMITETMNTNYSENDNIVFLLVLKIN